MTVHCGSPPPPRGAPCHGTIGIVVKPALIVGYDVNNCHRLYKSAKLSHLSVEQLGRESLREAEVGIGLYIPCLLPAVNGTPIRVLDRSWHHAEVV